MEDKACSGKQVFVTVSLLTIVKLYSFPYIINKKTIAAPPRLAFGEATLNLILPSVDCVTHNYPP